MSVSALWMGPVHSEARAAYHRAREAGLSLIRSMVAGSIASFRDCWVFRKSIAKHVGCSVRTVQRAITQLREEGLLGVARAKRGEVPHGAKEAIPCGWSHRWTVGWGQAGAAVKQAIAQARAKWLVKHMAPPPTKSGQVSSGLGGRVSAPHRPPPRRWTAEELDRELDRLDREKSSQRPTEKPPPDT